MEMFIGDAVMVVFGALISHGDDAERAVRAGLAVPEAVSQLKLEARGAVNTGEAVVNVQSGPATGEALAMGDVVNTASRLQNSAPAGSLVVGEEDRKSTRLNSSHVSISYAVFCLKKKTKSQHAPQAPPP